MLWVLWSAKRGTTKYTVSVAVVGGLLCAFWVVPFFLLHRYGTDMFYERNNNYGKMLFPSGGVDWAFTAFAAIGLLGSVLRRSRPGVFLGVMSIGFGAWAVLQPQSLLWNNRLLPFMYLTRYMLAAVGLVELFRAVARLINPDSRWLDWGMRLGALGVGGHRGVPRPRPALPGAAVRRAHQRQRQAGVRLAAVDADPEERAAPAT